MATFRTSQCQDGKENSKCYEWRCQGGAFKNALENLNARKSTSKNMLTGILSQNLWTYLYLDVFCCLQVSGSVAGGTYKWGETGLIPGEGDLWPDVSFCCWFTGKWTCNWGNLYVGGGGLITGFIASFTGKLAGKLMGALFSWGGGGRIIRGNLLYLQPEIPTIPLTDSVNCESLSDPNIHHASGFPRLYRKHWSTK